MNYDHIFIKNAGIFKDLKEINKKKIVKRDSRDFQDFHINTKLVSVTFM